MKKRYVYEMHTVRGSLATTAAKDERSGVHPRQRPHTAGNSNLVSDRPQDVVAGENEEEVGAG
jgi:hypothetical protein